MAFNNEEDIKGLGLASAKGSLDEAMHCYSGEAMVKSQATERSAVLVERSSIDVRSMALSYAMELHRKDGLTVEDMIGAAQALEAYLTGSMRVVAAQPA